METLRKFITPDIISFSLGWRWNPAAYSSHVGDKLILKVIFCASQRYAALHKWERLCDARTHLSLTLSVVFESPLERLARGSVFAPVSPHRHILITKRKRPQRRQPETFERRQRSLGQIDIICNFSPRRCLFNGTTHAERALWHTSHAPEI